jgi:hypothetical protein
MSGLISGQADGRASLENFPSFMILRAFPIPLWRGAAVLWAALMAAALAAGAGDAPANPFGAKAAAGSGAAAASPASAPANPFGPKSASTADAAGTGDATTAPARGSGGDDSVAKVRAMLLQRFDKNGDGALDATELAEARSVLSGGKDARPVTAQQAALAARGPLFGLRPLLQRYDQGGGQAFDAAALANIRQLLFGGAAPAAGGLEGLKKDIISQFDKNGDGKLDDAERAAAKAFLQQMMAELDSAGGKNSAGAQAQSAAASGSAMGPAASGEPEMK